MNGKNYRDRIQTSWFNKQWGKPLTPIPESMKTKMGMERIEHVDQFAESQIGMSDKTISPFLHSESDNQRVSDYLIQETQEFVGDNCPGCSSKIENIYDVVEEYDEQFTDEDDFGLETEDFFEAELELFLNHKSNLGESTLLNHYQRRGSLITHPNAPEYLWKPTLQKQHYGSLIVHPNAPRWPFANRQGEIRESERSWNEGPGEFIQDKDEDSKKKAEQAKKYLYDQFMKRVMAGEEKLENMPHYLKRYQRLLFEKKRLECCGPDVTEWFIKQLDTIRLDKRNDPTKPRSFLRFHRSIKFEQALDPWLSKKGPCKNTVLLCNTCIHVTELGNIAYGYTIANNIHIAVWGAIYAQVKTKRGLDKVKELYAYYLGQAFLHMRRKTKAGKTPNFDEAFIHEKLKGNVDFCKTMTSKIDDEIAPIFEWKNIKHYLDMLDLAGSVAAGKPRFNGRKGVLHHWEDQFGSREEFFGKASKIFLSSNRPLDLIKIPNCKTLDSNNHCRLKNIFSSNLNVFELIKAYHKTKKEKKEGKTENFHKNAGNLKKSNK